MVCPPSPKRISYSPRTSPHAHTTVVVHPHNYTLHIPFESRPHSNTIIFLLLEHRSKPRPTRPGSKARSLRSLDFRIKRRVWLEEFLHNFDPSVPSLILFYVGSHSPTYHSINDTNNSITRSPLGIQSHTTQPHSNSPENSITTSHNSTGITIYSNKYVPFRTKISGFTYT